MTPCDSPTERQRGFTLIEALIATLVALMILLVAFREVIEAIRHHKVQGQVSAMQQNGRNLVEVITREVLPAGYGLSDAPITASPIIANEPGVAGTFSDTAFTVRYNALDTASALATDMTVEGDNLVLGTTAGFAADQRVMIWDDTSAWEWLTIDSVVSGTELDPAADLSKVYATFDTPVVAVMKEISFRYDDTNDMVELQEDGGDWTPVARNVTAFSVSYFDKDNTEIFPASDSAREEIRSLQLEYTIRTGEADPFTKEFRTYSIDARITPRNLPLRYMN